MGCCNSCHNGGRFSIPGLCSQNPTGNSYPLPCASPYIVEIDTTITASGSSGTDQINFPLTQVNPITGAIVDWGDGTQNIYPPGPGGDKLHTYATPGVYRIYCCGITINRWALKADRVKLKKVIQWGNETWASFSSMFALCTNLQNINTPDNPILAPGANMDFMFDGTTCTVNAAGWNVSGVQRIESMFRNNPNFNADISGWNTGNMQDMDNAFRNAIAFNRDLSAWNVSNVTQMANFMTGKSSANFNPLFLANMYASWSTQPVQPNVNAGFGGIEYIGVIGAAGRAILTGAPNNWIITDGGGI